MHSVARKKLAAKRPISIRKSKDQGKNFIISDNLAKSNNLFNSYSAN
jgi:hypothetical protein